jgi:hypothetical protein
MYREVCEGKLDPAFFVPEKERMSLNDFYALLGKEMCSYDPKKQKFPGDNKMRVVTQQRKNQRTPSPPRKKRRKLSPSENEKYDLYKEAKATGRFTTMDEYAGHAAAFTRKKHGKQCKFCGEKAYVCCLKCEEEAALHCVKMENKECKRDGLCAFHYHNKNYFGLCFADYPLFGKDQCDWEPPTDAQIEANKQLIASFEAQEKEENSRLV